MATTDQHTTPVSTTLRHLAHQLNAYATTIPHQGAQAALTEAAAILLDAAQEAETPPHPPVETP